MRDFVVWLDSKEAHIYELTVKGVVKTRVEKQEIEHHRRHPNDKIHDPHENQFFRDLALQLKDAGQLLIMGPGLAKNHFKSHLETHHKNTLAKNIIGIENTEHLSENQVLAEARKFFKHYDLFNNPI